LSQTYSMTEVKDHFGDYALTKIPESETRTFLNQLMIFMGVLAVWAAVFAGAALASWFDAATLVVSVVIGCIILGVIAYLTGYIGSRTRASTYVILRHSTGRGVAMIAGLIISGISATIWFAYETWLFGVIMQGVFPDIPFMRVEVASIWGGLLMMTTALIGYRALSVLSYFIVPAWFVILPMALAAAIDINGGWAALMAAKPPTPADIGVGITFTVGVYIVGATIAPDVTRFSRKPHDGPLAWFIHVVLFMPIIMAAGGFLQLLAPGVNLVAAMVGVGMVWAVVLTGVVGQWTTNDNNLYSSSLAWCNVIPIKRAYWVAIMGIIGTIIAALIALGFGVSLEALLILGTLLGTWIPPMAAVMIADFYVVKPSLMGVKVVEKRYDWGPGTVYHLVNWPAVVAIVVGGFLAWWIPQIYPTVPGVVIGFGSSLALFIILMTVCVKLGVKYGIGKWVETGKGF
jgi:cytosine permease